MMIIAIMPACDSSNPPELEPEAPAALSGVPLEPESAVPGAASEPPVYGSSVASGKEEEVVVAIAGRSFLGCYYRLCGCEVMVEYGFGYTEYIWR